MEQTLWGVIAYCCAERTERLPTARALGHASFEAVFLRELPHRVLIKTHINRRGTEILTWVIDRHGPSMEGYIRLGARMSDHDRYWTRGVWAAYATMDDVAYYFQHPDDAFEFKMRWG